VELAVFICLICHFLVLRWRIERDYRELKQEIGLRHYEGRNWRGFHHHASFGIAAYGFLMLEPLCGIKNNTARLQTPAVPEGFLPRAGRRCSDTSHGPSLACTSIWREPSHEIFHIARVAGSSTENDLEFNNTVQLKSAVAVRKRAMLARVQALLARKELLLS
jgi:hypothetical protein